MSSNNTLVLPLVLWDSIAPHCNVSSLILNENETHIITGTTSGHIIIWEFKVDDITPICLLMGHTDVVKCLVKAGSTKHEEYLVSSSANGEIKLWEIQEKICLENVKTPNTIHKHIYSSKVSGKYTRLFCIGSYTDVLVIDPMSLEVVYTLVSREKHEWINVLCINPLVNKMEEVIVGISVTGIIKLWTIGSHEHKGNEVIEHEFKHSECENARTLVSCPGKQRIFLVVCAKFFQIFDAVYFSVLCFMNSKADETFRSGYFIDIDKIVVCTDEGVSYVYLLPDNANPEAQNFRTKVGKNETEKFSLKLLATLKANDLKELYSPPVYYYFDSIVNKNKSYLVRGDCFGRLSLWNINSNITGVIETSYDQSLQAYWDLNLPKDVEELGHVSTLLFLPNVDKLIIGTIDGVIIILSAFEYLKRRLFYINSENIKSTKALRLKKHSSKVTTLLYPNGESSRYDASLFVSGSTDFSVILWNINTGEMLYKFIVQAGEILQLSLPPNNVNPRISQCICSIASDNSVALLSLKEYKPVMVASRHLFPVLFIKWRALDDYLIVKCVDGGVYVWQMETGNLDRVAHGLIAEDIINAADFLSESASTTQTITQTNNTSYAPASSLPHTQSSANLSSIPTSTGAGAAAAAIAAATINANALAAANAMNSLTPANLSTKIQTQIVSGSSVANQTVSIVNTLQKRNFANSIKSIALKALSREEEQKKGIFSSDLSSSHFPLIMQTFHFHSKDPVNNLLLFDIDSLLVNLMLEEQSIESLLQHMRTNFYKEIHNIQTRPSQLAPLYNPTTEQQSLSTLRRNASAKTWDTADIKLMSSFKSKINYAHSIINLTRVLLSCLHAWNLDEQLDKLFMDNLGLYKPKLPISFGHISRHHHITLMFPKKLVKNQQPLIDIPHTPLTKEKLIDIVSAFTSREHWNISKCLTTEHLLTILSIANSFMNLQNFVDLQFKIDFDTMDFVASDLNSILPMDRGSNHGEEQALIKQTYSRLSTMYCMLGDYFRDIPHKALNLEILARKWMDLSFEVREAAQALLKNELKRLGPNGRSSLIKIWEPYLCSLLKDYEDVTNTSHVSLSSASSNNLASLAAQPQQQQQQQQPQQPQQNRHQLNVPANAPINTGGIELSTTSIISNQIGNLQAYNESVSRLKRKQYIAIIILGIMGAEFGQDINMNKSQTPYKTIPQGFSIEDHTILKRISIALAKLLTNKSLLSDVNRRAAIDLMGRGFNIWEPFIQPTYVILSLLELCADAELYIPRDELWRSTNKNYRSSLNLPLSPIADTCRTARYSLSLIANTKPKTFILTIAKEVKRVNSTSAQTTQNNQANYNFNNALVRGKSEILQIVEKLIDNQSQDVFELLSDVIEIILYCLDTNQIRNNGFEETFPAIFKFPMVRYCKDTRRIIVGCHNGRLIMYEYRTSKWHFQSFPAHNGQAIVAVAISPESKYIASYSAHDNSLYVWQSTGGNIFNIGSNSLKQFKVCTAAPIELNVQANKLATLVWIGKTLTLNYHDGRKFTYQI